MGAVLSKIKSSDSVRHGDRSFQVMPPAVRTSFFEVEASAFQHPSVSFIQAKTGEEIDMNQPGFLERFSVIEIIAYGVAGAVGVVLVVYVVNRFIKWLKTDSDLASNPNGAKTSDDTEQISENQGADSDLASNPNGAKTSDDTKQISENQGADSDLASNPNSAQTSGNTKQISENPVASIKLKASTCREVLNHFEFASAVKGTPNRYLFKKDDSTRDKEACELDSPIEPGQYEVVVEVKANKAKTSKNGKKNGGKIKVKLSTAQAFGVPLKKVNDLRNLFTDKPSIDWSNGAVRVEMLNENQTYTSIKMEQAIEEEKKYRIIFPVELQDQK